MLQPKNGKKLFLVLAIALLSGCVTIHQDPPPVIEICINDGHGGADCVEKDGTKLYRPPSQMKNYWSTSQDDEAAFAGWCYGTDKSTTGAVMQQIQEEAHSK